MGGKNSKSKSSIEILNDATVSITEQLINNCVASIQQDINVNLGPITGVFDMSGTNISQGAQIDLRCALSNQKKSEISYAVSNYLTNTAEANGSLVQLGWGDTKSQAMTNIQNRFNTAMTNVTENTVSATIRQNIGFNVEEVSGVFIMRNATIEQSAKAVAQSITHQLMQTGVFHELSSTLEQNTESGQSGLFGSLFGDMDTTTLMWIGAGILIFIIAIVLAIALGGDSSSSQQGYQGFQGYPPSPYGYAPGPYGQSPYGY